MTKDLKEANRNFGFSISLTKTKFMSDRKGVDDVWLEGAKLSRVEEYKYVGQTACFGNNMWDVIDLSSLT